MVVLDVGPAMHPYLDLASRALMDFVQSKVWAPACSPWHKAAAAQAGSLLRQWHLISLTSLPCRC